MAPIIKGLAPDLKEIKALVNTAQGIEKADIALTGGSLVNVYTGEIQQDTGVAIKGKRVAYIGKNIGPLIGPETQVIDVRDKIISPGFIDGHHHIMSYSTVENFLKVIIPGGTTTVITETMEMNFPSGYEGALEFIKSAEDQPVKIFLTLSPMVSISAGARSRVFNPALFQKLLRRNNVIGLGETYWNPVVRGEESLLQLFDLTHKSGKKCEGHTAGAKDGKLQAYAAAGNFSDHEPINVEETLERLRLGMHVMIREGNVRRDLAEMANILKHGIDLRRLSFCSDGIFPSVIIKKGYIEGLVQKAIDAGFDPILALQMGSLNAAYHFGLDDFIGGIAPGKLADIVILPDIRHIKAELVISNGRIIARNGRALVAPRPYNYPDWFKRLYSLSRPVRAEDLEIRINSNREKARVRVINYITSLVTKEDIMELPVSGGQILAQPDKDLLKVSIIDCREGPEKRFTGLLTGFGLKRGAIASGSAWDIFGIIVAGSRDSDMVLAANRVAELQGGAALVEDGKIVAEFALPVGSSVSEDPPLVLGEKIEKLQKGLEARGVPWPDGYLTLNTISTPAIPHIRISEEGLYSVREGRPVPLLVD